MKRNIKTRKIGSSTNLFILFLVSVPLIGFLFLEPILANIISQTFDMNINDVYNSTFLWIALYALLNGFLAELDNKQLNKNRININNAFSWALILVPVYLYKRGSILNKTYKIGGFKSQWPLMTWVLFFFLSALLMPV
jgi:uncharacterized membrane protein YozB (DUF420 family)|tara:strand:+ start:720 stop:1133 length:414 start_codon:yes stop_codon:yes gene_type:complete